MTINQNQQQPLLSVVQSVQLTKNMQRVILTGDSLKNFQLDQSIIGPHLKLMIPAYPGQVIIAPTIDIKNHKVIWLEDAERPTMRTYSVRTFDREKRQLTIDFVRHQGGAASAWALNAKPGDNLGIFDNRAGGVVTYNNQWLILLADMSGLPAISYTLENLPAHAQGVAIITVTHKDDIIPLKTPINFTVQWVISDNPKSLDLVDALLAVEIPDDVTPFIWGGMEMTIAKKLRRTILDHLKLSRDHFNLVNYWRIGMPEGGFKHKEE